MVSFATLLDAHLAMLRGSLVDGVEPGPDGSRYAWSETIPDPTLNFAAGLRTPAAAAFARAAAAAHGRAPAILAEGEEVLPAPGAATATYPARWMVRRTAVTAADDPAISRHAGAVPPPAFEAVFRASSDEPLVHEHITRHYVPALRRAAAPARVAPVHLVLHQAGEPAACASLYRLGRLAGLYNVSTRIDRQRLGLGARITAAAVAEAGRSGAALVFLQCPAGGPVERLYARAGFVTAFSPRLICL
ncbi:GNAT family N-acetyltransferase [Methylobacterium sp. A54F]